MRRVIVCDLVLLNGKIYTLDKENRVAEAVGVKDGRIVFVGSSREAEKLVGRETKVIDLKGKPVTPGLIDTHSHFALWGLYKAFYVDVSYPHVDSIARMIEVVREFASSKKEGEWIRGRGWNYIYYPEGRPPNRWDLDKATTEHPVVLWHVSGHMLVANSKALEIAGITRETQDPEGGRIDRDENGEPTGILREKEAMDLLVEKMPRFTVDDWMLAIKKATEEWVTEGITAVKDPTIDWATKDIVEAYKRLRERNELRIRVSCLYWVQSIKEFEEIAKKVNTVNDDVLKIPGIKIILDGAITSKTAWMTEDYKGERGNKGLPTLPLDEFYEIVKRSHSMGHQVCVHAIGDRAIEETIKAFEEAQREKPREDARHTIIHCMLPTDEHIERMRRIGLLAEVQTSFIYFLGDAYTGSLEETRLKKLLPVKKMINAGLVVANGADAPVTPFPPRYGIYGAVARKSVKGLDIYRGPECLTPLEAIATYTTHAAKCLFMEDKIGSIENGKYADMVVWEKDFTAINEEEIVENKPVYTIINGEIIYSKNPKQP